MTDMFKEYKQDNNHEAPENFIRFLNTDEFDEIVIGANNIYYFKLPIEAEFIVSYSIKFKQGLSVILERREDSCELQEYNHTYFIRCELTPEESNLFNGYNKDTHTQLSIYLEGGTVVYSDKYRLKITGTI